MRVHIKTAPPKPSPSPRHTRTRRSKAAACRPSIKPFPKSNRQPIAAYTNSAARNFDKFRATTLSRLWPHPTYFPRGDTSVTPSTPQTCHPGHLSSAQKPSLPFQKPNSATDVTLVKPSSGTPPMSPLINQHHATGLGHAGWGEGGAFYGAGRSKIRPILVQSSCVPRLVNLKIMGCIVFLR